MEEMDELVRELLFFDLKVVKIETEVHKAAEENKFQTSREIMKSWHFSAPTVHFPFRLRLMPICCGASERLRLPKTPSTFSLLLQAASSTKPGCRRFTPIPSPTCISLNDSSTTKTNHATNSIVSQERTKRIRFFCALSSTKIGRVLQNSYKTRFLARARFFKTCRIF